MAPTKRVCLFPYIGGKFYMAKHIISLFPPHKTYVEVFGGAGHVLLQKPPSRIEIFNDYDNDVYTVWKMVKLRGAEIAKELDTWIYSEKLFEHIKRKWKEGYKGKSDFERACRWIYLTNAGFSGMGYTTAGFSYGKSRNNATKFFNKLKNYPYIQQRLKNVQIVNKDFRDLLSICNNEDILLYCDPPYFGTEHYYQLRFTYEDHKDLAKLLNETKSKFILSYYMYDYAHNFYPPDKFTYLFFDQCKHSTYYRGMKNRPKSTEVIITNFKVDDSIKGGVSYEEQTKE